MTQPNGGDRRSLSPGLTAVVVVLLAAPFVGLLWVSSYSSVEPRLWGFPFFYWYQLLWVFLAAGLTFVAYQIVTRGRAPRNGTGGGGAPPGGTGGTPDDTGGDAPEGAPQGEEARL